MPLEGINQFNAQAYTTKNTKQTVTIPKEVEMEGKVRDVSTGGLTNYVAAGLAEIKRNLEKKLRRATRKVSEGMLSLLGIEGDEESELPGGMETVKRGLKEIFKNLQRKLQSDDQ